MLEAADAALNLLPALQGQRSPAGLIDCEVARLSQLGRLPEGEEGGAAAGTLSLAASAFAAGALRQSQLFFKDVSQAGLLEGQGPLSPMLAGQGPRPGHAVLQLAAAAPQATRLHLTACRLVHWLAGLEAGHRQRLLPFLGEHSGLLELLSLSCRLAQSSIIAAAEHTETQQRRARASCCLRAVTAHATCWHFIFRAGKCQPAIVSHNTCELHCGPWHPAGKWLACGQRSGRPCGPCGRAQAPLPLMPTLLPTGP